MRAHFKSFQVFLILVMTGAAACLYVCGERAARALTTSVPTATQVADALTRMRLTPETLAAAGVNQAGVSVVVENAHAYMSENIGELELADASVLNAKHVCDGLLQTIQGGHASVEQQNHYPVALGALEQAQNAQDLAAENLFGAAVSNLTNAQQSTLATIYGNAHWELPVPYLVVNRSQQEWVQLREALAQERITSENGGELPSAIATFLSQVRSNSAVSSAGANLSSHLITVTAAWNGTVAGIE